VESLEPEHPQVRFVARDSRTGESRGPAALTVKKDWSYLDAAIETRPSHSLRLVVHTQQGDQRIVSVRDVSWLDGQTTTRASLQFGSGYAPTVSPDGRFLYWSGRVFDLDRLADEPPLKPVGGRTAEYACHPDAAGFLLATLLQRTPDPKTGQARGVGDVAVYERLTGTLVRHIVTDEPWPFALSPDGLMVAALAPEGIRIWDIRSGKEIRRHAVTMPGVRTKGNSGTAVSFAPDSRRLAAGHWDGTVVIWDVSRPTAKAPALTAAELDRLWADLASAEGKTGWDGVFRLADSPTEAVPFLVKRVSAVKELAAADANPLLAELESPNFRTRELAAKRAKDWGDAARVVIESALKRNPGVDLRQRLELLATALSWVHPPIPDDLRRLRAISVLERIGTKEAQAKIDELAEGLAETRVTAEAKRARQRLAERTAPRE